MQRLIFLLLLLFLLCTCEGNTKARKVARGENYVPDPNYIYFKNVRQRNYREDDRGEAGKYFTYEDLYDSGASLIPVIYDNWMEDEAIMELHTRKDTGPATPSGSVQLLITSATGENKVSLPPRPSVQEIKQLDGHLERNRQVRILLGQDTMPALTSDETRFTREIFADYLRLVEAD